MQYYSTRDKSCLLPSAAAILRGIAPDGGLFVPQALPRFSIDEIEEMGNLPYPELAAAVLSRWLTDYRHDELLGFCREVYAAEHFESADTAPLYMLSEDTAILELFHGPTCAFKDFALQLLPRLLHAAARKCGEEKTVAILAATSGDTGKAALMGFADVPGTCIGVFYPEGGTSDIQRLQMVTQKGENVAVFAVKGNFDDAQSGVKDIFGDRALAERLGKAGILLSSANSINWGRLAPQTAYYFSAYAGLVKSGAVKSGQAVNFCVPTGNFGNILAGYLAKKSGLPVHKLICASNENNVLADFMETGLYDKNRPFVRTASPSMDILISSNLERLLFLLSGRDDTRCREWMAALRESGRYDVGGDMLRSLRGEGFVGGWAGDGQAGAEIARVFRETGYLCDPHTAVAVRVQRQYRARTGDQTPTVILSTASPFKFAPGILSALGEEKSQNEFAMLHRLSALSGLPVPPALADLRNQPVRFDGVCGKNDMRAAVCAWLERESSK